MNLELSTKNTKPYLGKRIFAGIIDYSIISVFMFLLLYFYGTPDDQGGYSLTGIPALLVILFWGFMTIGMEQLFGSTLGNSLNSLKPMSLTNSRLKISFSQSLKRHLLDVIDMSVFGLIGILLIINTEKHQRLGDLWAKTIVVSQK